MGSFHDSIKPDHIEWIREQPMFFVSTGPLSGDGHVNVSPKGLEYRRPTGDLMAGNQTRA